MKVKASALAIFLVLGAAIPAFANFFQGFETNTAGSRRRWPGSDPMLPAARGLKTMQRTIYSLLIAIVLLAGQPAGASIIVPPGTPVACDFVTGGGWIHRPGGEKANFGVGVGVKNGAFWGHLQYNDHSTNPPMQVHGTSVTGYFPGPDPNERIIMGTARINGVDGFTYTVEVIDNDEPGRDVDEFSIVLSNGYVAGSEYGDGPIAGGNIQLHKSNPSNTPPEGSTCAP